MVWHIGCSGFSYPAWKNSFYPSGLPSSQWITYYSTRFNSVELNSTFYKFPVVKNLKLLNKATPVHFRFSLKAHKIITHTLRMRNARHKVAEYCHIVTEGLGDKLGCVLFQLPGSFKFNTDNLDHVLESVPSDARHVMEFRDASWWNDQVFQSLSAKGLSMCSVSFPGLPDAVVPNADIIYMRFHGVPRLFYSPYSLASLKRFMQALPVGAQECYVYFNNTASGHAIRNAETIKRLAGGDGQQKKKTGSKKGVPHYPI